MSFEKKFAFFAKVFTFKRIRLIWLDVTVKRVNHEKKSHVNCAIRHILEQMNRKKKNTTKTIRFQFTNKESMV